MKRKQGKNKKIGWNQINHKQVKKKIENIQKGAERKVENKRMVKIKRRVKK